MVSVLEVLHFTRCRGCLFVTLAVGLLDEIGHGAKITDRAPRSFLALKSRVDQMFRSPDYFALPLRETENVELEYAVCLNFYQASLCRPDTDSYQGSTENCLLSFPSFQCQVTDNLFDVTLILTSCQVSINNLYEDIHMEFQNLQLQVFFFVGGGVRLVTFVLVPLKTKARLAELRNNLALRK